MVLLQAHDGHDCVNKCCFSLVNNMGMNLDCLGKADIETYVHVKKLMINSECLD